MGAKRIRGLLQKHSLVPVLKHVLLDLCEHNRYESMVVQVFKRDSRTYQPSSYGYLAYSCRSRRGA